MRKKLKIQTILYNLKVVYILLKRGDGFFYNSFLHIRRYGIRNSIKILINKIIPKPDEPVDLELVSDGPLISIVTPTYNTPISMLKDSIDSVLNQSYSNWELILVDDCSKNEEVRNLIKNIEKKDNRVRSHFRSENGNISKALNDGLNLVSAEYFFVLDHDDILDINALYWVAKTIIENPGAEYIYSDEGKIDSSGKRVLFADFYKPDWSPEYFLAMMYTCHISVFKTNLLKQIDGYRSDFDGAQDYDLTLRIIKNAKKIIHIPKSLYFWRIWEQSTAQSLDSKPLALDRARLALIEFLESKNESYKITDSHVKGHFEIDFFPKTKSLVSIVIPTANGTIDIHGKTEWHLDEVIQGILDKTTYQNYEIIIVHNGNLRTDQVDKFANYKNIILIEYKSKSFSLAEKINLGAASSNGEYLVIMNDDIRVISEDWLEKMLGMVQREGVGVVGPKLLFPDNTIQHAGVVLLNGLPGHPYYESDENENGYGLGIQVNRNYLAVTGACSITPKKLFEEIGGYSSRYPLNYNDVDYCLKAHQLGYRSVYLAKVKLYHYEGVSKEGGRTVAGNEIETFLEDWGEIYKHDPYYNPNLSQSAPYQIIEQ